jgi:hypothetical protein
MDVIEGDIVLMIGDFQDVDIEVLATTAVKERVAYCSGLQSYINERDKEPLWDGHIYVFPIGVVNKDKLIGRVPVQVKGKKKGIGRETATLSYNVEVSALKKYLQDGGITYFVVAFGENRNKTIFYKVLLPFDLQRIISKAGGKFKKAITLQRLPDDDNSIRQVFLAFIDDKKRQATQIVFSEEQAAAAVRDGATFKFHILPKNQPKSYSDVLKETTLQSFYMYVETKDGVEFPFAKIEASDSAVTTQMLDVPVYVNDQKYYNNISHGYENGKSLIYIGQALKLPLAEEGEPIRKHTFKFSLKGTLKNRIIDSDFILALSEYKQIRLDEDVIFSISVDNPKEVAGLKIINDRLKKIKAALDYFGVHTDLDVSTLSPEENRAIDDLIRAANGNSMTFKEKGLPRLFYYNKKVGNLVVRIVAKQEEKSDAYKLFSAFVDEAHVKLEVKHEDDSVVIIEPWSLFLYMKADDFLCSNMDYSTVLNSIKSMKPDNRNAQIRIAGAHPISTTIMLLNIITAYDSQTKKDKELLQFAHDMAVAIESNDPVTIINKFQVIKRQRPLTNDEIAALVALKNKRKQNEVIKCAISILLGEDDAAKKMLTELPEEDRKGITNYPIYRLLATDTVLP